MIYYHDLIYRYRQKGILIDTKPLLLLFVGTYDVNRIKNLKHIAGYTEDDYKLLIQILDQFIKIVTTPNILTEASNLLNHIRGRLTWDHCLLIAEYVKSFKEEFTHSSDLVQHKYFCEFGLADIATIDNAKGKYLVLTCDGPLHGYLLNMKVDSINFDKLLISLKSLS